MRLRFWKKQEQKLTENFLMHCSLCGPFKTVETVVDAEYVMMQHGMKHIGRRDNDVNIWYEKCSV